MDVQHACLTKIVVDGDILPFIEAKIGDQFFPDAKHLQVWKLIIKHYKAHGAPPSEDAVHKAYPTYKFPTFTESTDYYLNQLRQDRTKVLLTQGVQEFADRLNEEEGPEIGDDLELILRRALNSAAHEITRGKDTDFFLSRERIMKRLEERRTNPGILRGISTGFDGIDKVTGGLQDQQLITLIGTPKAGKSSVLLYMALTARKNGNPVLFLTFEMSTEEQEDRLVSLLSGVALTKILNGTFSPVESQKIDRAMKLREALAGFIITSDITSALTLTGVQAKVQQYRPRFLCVDGVYLMDDEQGEKRGSSQALTNLTRGFKRLAQIQEIPIAITTQALLSRSRGGLQMDSVGYSSSFAQDSDLLLGTEAHEEVENVSRFKVLASRSGPKGDIYMVFDWDHGEIRELTPSDYQEATDENIQGTQVKPAKKSQMDSLYEQEDETDAA